MTRCCQRYGREFIPSRQKLRSQGNYKIQKGIFDIVRIVVHLLECIFIQGPEEKKNVTISRVNFHWIRRVRPCLSFAGRFVKNKLLCYHATRLVSFFSLLLVKILKTSNKDSNEAASIDPFRWLCVIKIRFTLKSQISDTISLSQ